MKSLQYVKKCLVAAFLESIITFVEILYLIKIAWLVKC